MGEGEVMDSITTGLGGVRRRDRVTRCEQENKAEQHTDLGCLVAAQQRELAGQLEVRGDLCKVEGHGLSGEDEEARKKEKIMITPLISL